MDKEKEVWTKPQLIVLGRGRPEESVLGACKVNPQSSNPQYTPPDGVPRGCWAVAPDFACKEQTNT